jgi:hypothetical protein
MRHEGSNRRDVRNLRTITSVLAALAVVAISALGSALPVACGFFTALASWY